MKKIMVLMMITVLISLCSYYHVTYAQLGDILTDVVNAKANKKMRKVADSDKILPEKLKKYHCILMIASMEAGLTEGGKLFRKLEEQGEDKEKVLEILKDEAKRERERANISQFSEKIYCAEQTFLPVN